MKNKKNGVIVLMMSFFLVSCHVPQKLCFHNYNETKVEPTCVEKGYTVHKCEKCGKTYNDNYVAALGHKYMFVSSTKEIFGQDGCEDHYQCLACDQYFDKDKNPVKKEDVIRRLQIYDLAKSKDPVFAIHGPIELTINLDNLRALETNLNALASQIENGDSSIGEQTLVEKYNQLVSVINQLPSEIRISAIIENVYNRPSDYETNTLLSRAYTTLFKIYYRILIAASKVDRYKTVFYSGLSKSEIDAKVENYTKSLHDFDDNPNQEMDEIKNDYKAGKINRFETISQFVAAANRYGKSRGYKNYLDYAYPCEYGREYSMEDVAQLEPFLENYIVPLYEAALQKDEEYNSQVDYVLACLNKSRLTTYFFGQYLDELTKYAGFLGDIYKKNFTDYFEKGIYYYSNIENKNVTGYVWELMSGEQIMFLGKDYQSVDTFIHEFGHYNSGITFGNVSSYDLAETQSQGNEMLFYSYLAQQGLIDQKTAEVFLNYKLQKFLKMILISYEIDTVEQYIYQNEDFTQSELESKWVEIGSKFGMDLTTQKMTDYLYDVLINYNGYYISYGVSAIASLEVYAKSLESLESAKTSYLSITAKDSKDESFNDSLANAGLYDVFSEDAYKLLATI